MEVARSKLWDPEIVKKYSLGTDYRNTDRTKLNQTLFLTYFWYIFKTVLIVFVMRTSLKTGTKFYF